jgi:hypothetical protein
LISCIGVPFEMLFDSAVFCFDGIGVATERLLAPWAVLVDDVNRCPYRFFDSFFRAHCMSSISVKRTEKLDKIIRRLIDLPNTVIALNILSGVKKINRPNFERLINENENSFSR